MGSRRSTGRRRTLRSPSPMPSSPRPSKSTPLPASTLPSSPLPSPSPHSPSSTNHMQSKGRTQPKEQSPEQEVVQTSNHKQLPASKEVKQVKVEPTKEGADNPPCESMETEQGQKVKGTSSTSKLATVNANSNDIRNAVKNSIHRRKRERTPSPTPSVPGPKRRPNSPTSQSVVPPVIDATGQSSNPRTAQPTVKPLSGGNNSLKVPGPVRLVKPEMSSASKVLNEEILKQQGQENARLKMLIFKEVKKQGKSEQYYMYMYIISVHFTVVTFVVWDGKLQPYICIVHHIMSRQQLYTCTLMAHMSHVHVCCRL